MTYLALDPGLTFGWATFNDEGDVTGYGQAKDKELIPFLQGLLNNELKAIIVEDYKNHGWMQQQKWGRNETSKSIGKIEALAELHNVPVHLQPNTVKNVGYAWAGLGKAPDNHSISHQFDAVAHGIFWLQSNGIRPIGKGWAD